jgi:hypothetical protein
MIEHLVKKLESLEEEISSNRGEFSLFALVLREDAEDRWDLIVAAPWIDPDSIDDLKYIIDRLKSRVDENELLSISSVILLESYNPIVLNMNKMRVVRGGKLELSNPQLYGLPFKHAYIIISQGDKPVLINVRKRGLRQTV